MDDKKIVEYTMDMGRVSIIAMAMIIPIIVIYITPFILIWDIKTLSKGFDLSIIYILPIFIGGIVFHELFHGVTWAFFIPKGFKSIKFGVNWKYFTPYCHCKVPIKVKHYMLGAAMPLIVLGIAPAITGIIIGHGSLLFFGMFFTWAAGGDIIAMNILRKLDMNIYVSDHPEKMGFYMRVEG